MDSELEKHLFRNYSLSQGETNHLTCFIQQEIAKAREQAIEDIKYAGYGYDDGTGFVLKISYAELATLKEHKEE